ncbi:DUF4760 domain-containing protein [uncultured Cocleimonas sp.]|uniref:DUF4760 domain-containing protein n=1 Tax=uncultured Cocleimonas sp. TaxID=1051587 RepID=UPI00260E1E09|nr:DUF4760 domain-containing protein [uncultured Cocleimonas sp.]
MTLQEFSKDIVPILQLLVSFVGVVGLVLLWYQIRLTHQWNKANSQHALLSNLPDEDHEKRFWKIIEDLDVEENGALTKESADKIYSNSDHWVCVKQFLNKFEQLCAAVNAQTIDDNYAYSVHSARITDTYHKFKNYIIYSREKAEDDEIYIELEVVASRWHERYLNTKEHREQKLAAAQESLNKEKGTKAIVP